MPIDWRPYDEFDWNNAQQAPMDGAHRDEITRWTAELLGLDDAAAGRLWGEASPPGRFAATVIHVLPGIPHCYSARAAALGVAEIGVKVFKTNGDARREAKRVVPFHKHYADRLPGLPNPHVQRSIDGGARRDMQHSDRDFVVQEWVAGDNLEDLIRRRWTVEPIDARLARLLLEQLLGDIVIPLWSAGTVWWDVRDANYCWDGTSQRLTLIDVDSLGAECVVALSMPETDGGCERGEALLCRAGARGA